MRIRRTSHTQTRRHGLTLYEVVLATIIFMMAMAGISQVISIGSQASVTAKLESEAALHAESLLGEVVAGAKPLDVVAGETFLTTGDGAVDERWVWSMTVEQTDVEYLQKITLTVNHQTDAGRTNASFTLQRLMRDPQLFTDAAEAAAQKETDAAADAESGGM